ncbi:MBL fold metallo-hydrolase [Agromyces seonyuensis]|uniref:MBL fold metallo-hydrolase n=1 Tax=Agromyces seonyuensis TaxID=2662446 RepID=A0A6I4NU98_9MICO|nr:MBL fold metallo-hydrolase [Agromyces seonyuensis]MWB97671.1 MBL fold metallo-hydrolase [Agromyces seonyuensis]
MRITKFEHAELVLEEAGSKLVVDPGNFSRLVPGPEGVAAVVITHEHPDHWTPEQLASILAASPDARVFGAAGVAAAVGEYAPVEVVHAGDEVVVGPFALRFYGGRHAVIHSTIPVVDNLGVLVNGVFAYSGDSFAVPPEPVDVLAAPAGAPWMKIAETMDYVLEVAPKRVFAVHDAVLSGPGKAMADGRLTWAVEQGGGSFVPLSPGESFEV